MDELRKYLNETLGLKIEYGEWLPDANLPLFLSRSASYARCVFEGIAFVAAKMENEDGLPDIKRVHNQLGRYTDLPVVIVSETLDARQRKALVVQGVPFVVPGVQAFLPFLAFAATSREPRRLLSSPVSGILHVERNAALNALPDAGETALAVRSMLAVPPIRRKAVSRKRLKDLSFSEVLIGEIDDNDTIELQVWTYEPLVTGGKDIDDVSLALSLADSGDERVEKELNSLFDEEDLW